MRLLQPKKGLTFLCLTIPLCILPYAQPVRSAMVYYVATTGQDSNSGSQSSPFATLSAAATRAKPGDVIYVRGGTYYYPNEQYIGSIGTSTASITYQPYSGETVILDGSKLTSNTNVVNVAGAYNIFKGFQVKNAKQIGIVSWGGKNIQIRNNTVSNSARSGIFVGYTDFTTTSNIVIDGNIVYNNCLSNQSLTATGGWPTAISSFKASNITISNNNVYQNYGEGIGFALTKGGTASRNTIRDNYSVNFYLDNATNITVERNHIYTTNHTTFYRFSQPASGIQIANEPYDLSNPNNMVTIRNNIVRGGREGLSYYTYGNGGGLKNFVIANNTFYQATSTMLFIQDDAGHTNNLIANNIFHQINGKAMTQFNGSSAFSFRTNNWYGGTAGKAAGTGDLNTNPLLVKAGGTSSGDYSLLSTSSLKGKGTTITQVLNDYAGTKRPLGTLYEIGAFEVL